MQPANHNDLLQLLRSKDWKTRLKAVEALTDFVDEPDVFEELVNIFNRDNENLYVRAQVAKTFGQAKTAKGFEPLFSALSSPDVYLRYTSETAIGNLMANKVPDIIDLLFEKLNTQNERLRNWIADTISHYADANEVIPKYLRILKAGTEYERMGAAYGLGYFEDREAVAGLIEALNDSNWEVRYYGITGLEAVGGKDVLTPLKKLLDTEDNEKVREAAKESIRNLGL